MSSGAPGQEDFTFVNLFRLAIYTVVLGIAVVQGHPLPLALMSVGEGFAVLWLILEKWRIVYTPRTPRIALIPTTVDLILISYFVTLTGNIHSIMISGYYVTILICSMNVHLRHGLYAAILSIALYAVTAGAVLVGLLPAQNIFGHGADITVSSYAVSVFLNAIGFLAVQGLVRTQIVQVTQLVKTLEVSEQELTRGNEIIRLLLRDFEAQSSDWLFELDAAGRVTYASDKLQGHWGPTPLVGQTVRDILPAPFAETVMQTLDKGLPFKNLELPLPLLGPDVWVSLSAVPLTGEGSAWRGVGRDVTARKRLEAQLQRKAYVDEPTGLPNRHRFRELVEETLAEGPQRGIFGIIHLGNLGKLRTTLGSSTSNTIVESFLQAVREDWGRAVVLARLDQDELGFWAPHADVDLLDALHRFARRLRGPQAVGAEAYQLGMTIGIAFYPDDAEGSSGLFRAADLALDSARVLQGRNLVRYNSKLSSDFLRGMELIHALPSALEGNQLRMVYQPQVEAVSGRVNGAEALVRWTHPILGPISPGEFIPLAEQNGFIVPLGEWTLATVCRDAVTWDPPVPVSVNVSGVQLSDPRRLRHTVRSALSSSGLPAERLVLEITESAVFQFEDDLNTLLREFRSQGIQIALDDFGTGYSSLAYLHQLPLDKLKIDQSFVRNLGSAPNAEGLLESIVALAASLGLTTVAEGVETEDQARFLVASRCDTFQGYLFGKPLPLEDFRRRIASAPQP